MPKSVGGLLALDAGNFVGAGRGAAHTVEDVGRGALFLSRLIDPSDAAFSPPGQSAADQVIDAGRRAVDYVGKGIANPRGVARDLNRQVGQLDVDLNPYASPVADTLGGELRRQFDIGKNQGELGFDVGTLLYGGPVLKAARELGAAPEAAGAAKFLAQGFSPAEADYLAAPYVGRGHHLVARRFRVPEAVAGVRLPGLLAGKPLPAWYSESPLNVLKPEGMSRGDFYELHHKVDPYFHFARMPRRLGGSGWNGNKLGLQRYGRLGRVWHGSPAPLKAAVGGATGGAGALAYGYLNGEQRQ